jgi:hypothetical protein
MMTGDIKATIVASWVASHRTTPLQDCRAGQRHGFYEFPTQTQDRHFRRRLLPATRSQGSARFVWPSLGLKRQVLEFKSKVRNGIIEASNQLWVLERDNLISNRKKFPPRSFTESLHRLAVHKTRGYITVVKVTSSQETFDQPCSTRAACAPFCLFW